MSRAITKRIALGVLVLGLTTGCAGMSARQQRALSGGAIGAAGGAALGAIAPAAQLPAPLWAAR